MTTPSSSKPGASDSGSTHVLQDKNKPPTVDITSAVDIKTPVNDETAREWSPSPFGMSPSSLVRLPCPTKFIQSGENDPAWLIIAHKPAIELLFAALHPEANLFEDNTTTEAAAKAHVEFVTVLSKYKIQVKTVREILLWAATNGLKDKVQAVAMKSLVYQYAGDITVPRTKEEDDQLNRDYKRRVIERMSATELVDIVLLRPVILLKPSDTPQSSLFVASETHLQPLGNMVFMRDQQIVTRNGIVMGRLSTVQRRFETELMELVFDVLKMKDQILYRIADPGTLEGGDFYPVSPDLCLIGVGLRTNVHAVGQMLERDVFGTNRVAIVYDYYDRSQKRMHLDTVLNFVDSSNVVVLNSILGHTNPRRRMVSEYHRKQLVAGTVTVSSPTSQGASAVISPPSMARSPSIVTEECIYQRPPGSIEMELEEWLTKEGFGMVRVSEAEQEKYMVNFLNVGNGQLVTVHKDLETRLNEAKVPYTSVEYCEYDGIKRMFGAAHCSTMVFRQANPLPVASAGAATASSTASGGAKKN